jgi:nitrogen fixation/metabolism regulation signal transduction histidine kinase
MAEAHGRRLMLRSFGVVAGASAAGGAAAFVAASAGEAPSAVALAAGLLAAGSGVVLGALLVRPFHAVLDALGAALLSYRDNDFSVRLADERAVRGLVERFNQLGELLRRERNTVYQKELMLETLLEAATFAVVLCDEPGTVLYANGAARELFAEGRPLSGEAFRPVLDRVAPGLAADGGREGALVTIETPGGPEVLHASTRWFELNTERHALHIFKSMTRELARQEVEIWKRTIRVVSHEVDNSLGPVSSLVSSGRAILDRPEHAHRLREVLGTIQERVEHLRTFLDGYARLARLPAPRPGPVEWQRFLSSLNVLYPFRLDGAVPAEPGWFDAAQLQQVLVNLLKNAVESGSARDEIALRVRRARDDVEIAVLDRGAGLSDEALARALQLFYTTKKTGSGLGLALSREIVEAHGGRLALERREGGGTAATIRLPASPAPLE